MSKINGLYADHLRAELSRKEDRLTQYELGLQSYLFGRMGGWARMLFPYEVKNILKDGPGKEGRYLDHMGRCALPAPYKIYAGSLRVDPISSAGGAALRVIWGQPDPEEMEAFETLPKEAHYIHGIGPFDWWVKYLDKLHEKLTKEEEDGDT